MNIYTYLKKDHKKVSDIFEKIIAAPSPTQREELFERVKEELLVHMQSEQKTFYKALQQYTKTSSEEAEHAKDEHKDVQEALASLSELDPASKEWLIQFGEVKSMVEHHVDEEEGEMFTEAKKHLSEKAAEELAMQMDALKQRILEKFEAEHA